MKRRVAALMLALLMAGCTLCGSASAENAVIDIHDADGLRDMVNHPGAHFRLTGDINLEGNPWTPIPFSGELDGGGFGIYNMTVTAAGTETRLTHDGNMKEYETVFAGLFSVAEEAVIRDLRIIGAQVTVDAADHCFAAILAGFIDRCTIDGVTVEGRVRLNNEAVMAGVAGVAGYGSGYIDNCTAKVELIFEDRNFTSKCEQFMGGILSCGYTRLRKNTVDIDGYISCNGYVHSGGLMGLYYTCGTKFPLGWDNRIINDNTVTGRIYFFEHNRNRRAYCSGAIGEILTKLYEKKRNNIRGFKRKETKDYKHVLLPETCEEPVYEVHVTEPADGQWGWTEHVCTGCGYSWRDCYTEP